MANSSHCRYENTYKDLLDCYKALREEGSVENAVENATSHYEVEHITKLIGLCKDIVNDFEEELEEEN